MILLAISLNSKSTPTTKLLPELKVISQVLSLLAIPSFKKEAVLKSKGFGTKAGADHAEVAEYSFSAYR